MLSYQHPYHAGGQADVHKHMILCDILTKMTEDQSPLAYIDTHAGRGLYDLTGPEAEKTGEAERGLLAALRNRSIPNTHPYFRMVHDRKRYPGSPRIAQKLLRPNDRLYLFEMHPKEAVFLKQNMIGVNIRVYNEDGYDGTLTRLVPPDEGMPKRGLILIDPSYEVKEEYDYVPEFVREVEARWPGVTIMVWYPILKAAQHDGMVEAILAAHPDARSEETTFINERAIGSGIIIINGP